MPSNSGYGNGGSFTNVTSGPSGMDVSKYLQALLASEQKFMGQKARAAAPKKVRVKTQPDNVLHNYRSGTDNGGGEGDGINGIKKAMMLAQLGQAQAESQAAQMPAPLRMVSGPGVVPGYTMDTLAMGGAQRKAYLPDSSQQLGGFGDPPSPSDLDFAARMAFDRERQRRGEGYSSLSGARGATPQYFGGR